MTVETLTKIKFINGATPDANNAAHCANCKFSAIHGSVEGRTLCYGVNDSNEAIIGTIGSSQAHLRPCVNVTEIIQMR